MFTIVYELFTSVRYNIRSKTNGRELMKGSMSKAVGALGGGAK